MQPAPVIEPQPEWDTKEARRHRTLVFLILAGLYVGCHLLARWVEYPFFHGDWYYFGGDPPPWYEVAYRWFLTLLPLAAWGAILFFLLTRLRCLTCRRVALFVVLTGLVFLEADMRWFQMSRKHVSYSEIVVFFSVDATNDLGLRPSDYWEFWTLFGIHALSLLACALAAGPEVKASLAAVWNGPFGKTYFAFLGRKLQQGAARLRLGAGANRALKWVESRPTFFLLAGLVFVDPIIIWALDKENQNAEESRTVVRDIAETNPLRWHALDRTWGRIIHRFSEQSQDLAAANDALRDFDLSTPLPPPSRRLCIPNRTIPETPDNVLILQCESLSAAVFHQTKLPFIQEFSKKCLTLRRHFSTANATHYGVMGLLQGNPVTFFTGPLQTPRPGAYLEEFKNRGYSSRVIARPILYHHHLGDYLPNWTEPVFEAGHDFGVIPEVHKEFAKPGPRLVYAFFHATHYPYRHGTSYNTFQPEVEEDFVYNRSDLILWRENIINRYKNSLLELDDWFKGIIEKVDLKRTIIIITGDHGEEFFEQGRLGHCSSLNVHQTMTPCLFYVPGLTPGEVAFPTSHADMMPSIADALGWKTKPEVLGQSIFQPVPFRYAVISHFEYEKCKLWGIITEDRKTILERDYWNKLEIMSLVEWHGRRLSYREDPQAWADNFRIIRQVEAQLMAPTE